ncbi:MAG: hypothetical protein GX575_08480 [Candidatus Anammoximicrobium sp.]|nr:hypothetical protein [Candidatus Anammoximicrobium sp.]
MRDWLLLLLLLALPGCAATGRHVEIRNGREVVVHRNAAPVVLHRLLPPYGVGRHVYCGSGE